MNHTIGPWKIYEGMDAESILKSGWVLVVCRNNAGRIVANVNLNGGPGSKPMPCMDNARLIAAAPDLLAALEGCVKSYEEFRDGQPTGHLWPDPAHIYHARHAIHKSKEGVFGF